MLVLPVSSISLTAPVMSFIFTRYSMSSVSSSLVMMLAILLSATKLIQLLNVTQIIILSVVGQLWNNKLHPDQLGINSAPSSPASPPCSSTAPPTPTAPSSPSPPPTSTIKVNQPSFRQSFVESGDKDISSSKMAFLLPISIVILNFGLPICNIPIFQFSNRRMSVISIVGVCLSVLGVSFCDQFWQYLIIYGLLFSLFIGYGYMAPIKNAMAHIPNRKGLCSGVCILGYGISSLLFTFLLLFLINPDKIKPTDIDGKSIYPTTVTDNLPLALKIMSGVYLIIGLIGSAMMIPPNQQKSQKNQQVTLRQSMISNDSSQNKLLEKEAAPVKKEQQKDQMSIFTVIKEGNVLLLTLTLTCSVPFGMFIAFNYKEYGHLQITDETFLTTVGSLGSVFNGLGRLFWGVLLDRFSFKAVSTSINIILLAFSVTMQYLVKVDYMYLIAVCLIYLAYGGNYSVYPTHTVRTLGNKYGPKLYYVVFIGFSLGCTIQWLCRLFLVPETESNENKEKDFAICFYIFGGLNLLASLLSIFVKYEPLQAKDVKQTEKSK